MEDNFPQCLKFVLKEEGGRSDDKRDHGGRTAFGITQKEYWADQDRRGIPHSDVWQITDQEIRDIYHQYYWLPYCPQLPSGIDLSFFDFCVNAGRLQAVKNLQRSVTGIPIDGVMGARTFSSVEQADLNDLVNNYAENRDRFYHALKQYPIFGKGWSARTQRCRSASLALIAGSPKISTAIVTDDQSPKAKCEETADPMISPEQAGGASAGFGTASGAINQISQQLEPYQYTLHIVQYILFGLAVFGIGFMIYGLIRRNKIKAVT